MFKKKLDQDLIKYLEKLEKKIDKLCEKKCDNALEEKIDLIIKKNIDFDNLNKFLEKLNESTSNFKIESIDHFKIQNEKIYKTINDNFKIQNQEINTNNEIMNTIKYDLNIVNDNINKNNVILYSKLKTINDNFKIQNDDVNKKYEILNIIKDDLNVINDNINNKLDINKQLKTINDNFNFLNENLTNKFNINLNDEEKIIKNQNEIDLKLRKDLQIFLLGLQNELTNTMKNTDKYDIINKSIQDLNEKVDTINVKVNDFYYENEIIKHQIMLEEELKYYESEIDSIKSIVLISKTEIEEMLNKINLNV